MVDELVAVDIDEDALKKIVRITPDKLKKKLTIKIANIAKALSFDGDIFDGIFCVGTLHLFPKQIFRNIFTEMERVLKPGGKIIIDFATDIKRTYPDGSLWIIENEPNYILEDALIFLKEVFKNYDINLIIDKVEPEGVVLKNKKYIFTSNFILLSAQKRL